MAFNNPIAQQNIGNFTVQSAPVDRTGEAVAGLGSALLGLFEPKRVSREAVNDEQKTQGAQTAVSHVKRYKEIESTQGRAAAKRWLNANRLEALSSGSFNFTDAYDQVMSENLGTSFVKQEEDMARDLEKQQVELFNRYKNTGAEIIAGNGGDPSTMTDEQLMLFGQRYDGKGQIIARSTAEEALATAQFNAGVRDRNLRSTSAFSDFSFEQETSVRGMLAAYATRVAGSPNEEMQIRTEFLQNLSLQRASLTNNATRFLNDAGGSITDVQSRISEIERLYTSAEELLSGKLGIQVSEDALKKLSLDTTFDFLSGPQAGSRTARAMLINNTARFPVEGLVDITAGAGNRSIQKEAAVQAADGIARASRTYKLTPQSTKQLYSDLVQTVDNLSRVQDPVSQRDAGRSIVNNLVEGFAGTRSAIQSATAPSALPTMFSELAKIKPNANLSIPVLEAAAAEGLEPVELWTENAVSVMRTQVVPSLQVDDPNFRDNILVEFSGGRFRVTYDQERYKTKDTSLGLGGRNVTGFSQSLGLRQQDRAKAVKIEKLLNDMALSYAKVMNTDTNEVGPAIQAQVNLALGLAGD